MDKINFRLVWGVIMLFVYLCMAFLIAKENFFGMTDTVRYIVGALIFVYGIFRGIRLWRQGV